MKQIDFAKVMNSLIERKEPFVLGTVVRIQGSSLGKPGFKVLISKHGDTLCGSLGGMCPDSVIAGAAQKTLETGNPRIVKVYLESVEKAVAGTILSQTDDEVHVETDCGGMMEVYVEPYLPQQRLFLVAQGGKDDVEDALVRLGKMLDFEVTVIDHSPVLTEEPDELITGTDFDLSGLMLNEADSIVVLTKGARDVGVLEALSKFRPRFVGLLASGRRAKDDIDQLAGRGVDKEFVSRIRAPVGADIGAVTPAEIALSIMSDIVAAKYDKVLPRKGTREEAPMGVRRSNQTD
ncbi:MAG: XdhC family protein [Nitrososphaerales archaeon]